MIQNLFYDVTFFTVWEFVAVSTGVVYLLLISRQNPWGWPVGALSTLMFSLLFFRSQFAMQAVLQLYYAVMAGLGWWSWQYGGQAHTGVDIVYWGLFRHLKIMVTIVLLSSFSWIFLTTTMTQVSPFLDALITWASVIATYMTTQKVLENWLYWIVINMVSAGLFFHQGLTLTGLLAVFYAVVAMVSYVRWRCHDRGYGMIMS